MKVGCYKRIIIALFMLLILTMARVPHDDSEEITSVENNGAADEDEADSAADISENDGDE